MPPGHVPVRPEDCYQIATKPRATRRDSRALEPNPTMGDTGWKGAKLGLLERHPGVACERACTPLATPSRCVLSAEALEEIVRR
jgi:hypothetical protein